MSDVELAVGERRARRAARGLPARRMNWPIAPCAWQLLVGVDRGGRRCAASSGIERHRHRRTPAEASEQHGAQGRARGAQHATRDMPACQVAFSHVQDVAVMKRLASVAALLLLVVWPSGCENAKSKLDARRGRAASSAEPAPVAADHSGDVETRCAASRTTTRSTPRRSTSSSKVYAQQKQQQAAAGARASRDPNAVFAVDIAQNVKAGHGRGPGDGALVTIVEAWDFA